MKFRFDETFPNFLLYADLPLFLPLFVEWRKAFGLSPSSSLTPPSGFFFFFGPSFLSLFSYRPLPKALLSPYKAGWGASVRVATGIQVSNSTCLRLRIERKFSAICPSGRPRRGTWLVGEEEEAAWPESSGGLVRPVLPACHTPSREAGFVSFHTLSVLGPLSRREPHPYFASKPA